VKNEEENHTNNKLDKKKILTKSASKTAAT